MSLPSREHLQLIPSHYTNSCGRILPLYSGAQVTIYIGSQDHKYTLPKALLRKQSPYFSAMFGGGFKEGEEQTATLELVDGVVSVRAFEMLAQWLCIGRIVFKELAPEESITAAVEFSRLADMCGITSMEANIARHMKDVIKANSIRLENPLTRSPGINTYCITAEHIISASHLPDAHYVRMTLAAASVEGYMLSEQHKFTEEAQYIAGFSADLLTVVKETMNTMRCGRDCIEFEEPISGKFLVLKRFDPYAI